MKIGCLVLAILTSMTFAQSNPVPFVNNPLVPGAVAPGGPGFTLTVNGTGFLSTSTVLWNNIPLASTFISGSKLSATVPATLIATPNTASVSVVNSPPAGIVSNVIMFDIRQPFNAVSFDQSTLTVGSTPTSLTEADLNNDGKLDLIVTDGDSSAVSVLIGNGDGTFQPQAEYSVSQFPLGVIAGDLNGDGKLDLAVTTSSGFLSVLIVTCPPEIRPEEM